MTKAVPYLPDTSQPKPLCSRCGRALGNHWTDQWPNHGDITVGYPAQAFNQLVGEPSPCADQAAFDWWQNVGHPVLKENGAQKLVFHWKHGDTFQMCQECQGALIRLLGEFFGMPESMRLYAEMKGKP